MDSGPLWSSHVSELYGKVDKRPIRADFGDKIVLDRSRSLSLDSEVSSLLPCHTVQAGARFSKVPKAFRALKAICEIANRLFWKADLLTCI